MITFSEMDKKLTDLENSPGIPIPGMLGDAVLFPNGSPSSEVLTTYGQSALPGQFTVYPNGRLYYTRGDGNEIIVFKQSSVPVTVDYTPVNRVSGAMSICGFMSGASMDAVPYGYNNKGSDVNSGQAHMWDDNRIHRITDIQVKWETAVPHNNAEVSIQFASDDNGLPSLKAGNRFMITLNGMTIDYVTDDTQLLSYSLSPEQSHLRELLVKATEITIGAYAVSDGDRTLVVQEADTGRVKHYGQASVINWVGNATNSMAWLDLKAPPVIQLLAMCQRGNSYLEIRFDTAKFYKSHPTNRLWVEVDGVKYWFGKATPYGAKQTNCRAVIDATTFNVWADNLGKTLPLKMGYGIPPTTTPYSTIETYEGEYLSYDKRNNLTGVNLIQSYVVANNDLELNTALGKEIPTNPKCGSYYIHTVNGVRLPDGHDNGFISNERLIKLVNYKGAVASRLALLVKPKTGINNYTQMLDQRTNGGIILGKSKVWWAHESRWVYDTLVALVIRDATAYELRIVRLSEMTEPAILLRHRLGNPLNGVLTEDQLDMSWHKMEVWRREGAWQIQVSDIVDTEALALAALTTMESFLLVDQNMLGLDKEEFHSSEYSGFYKGGKGWLRPVLRAGTADYIYDKPKGRLFYYNRDNGFYETGTIKDNAPTGCFYSDQSKTPPVMYRNTMDGIMEIVK